MTASSGADPSTPLDRARLEWQVAKVLQADKDTTLHRERVEMAQAYLDYLLDTFPLSPSPSTPAAQSPGVPVSRLSLAAYRELYPQEGECDGSTTAQHNTGNEGD